MTDPQPTADLSDANNQIGQPTAIRAPAERSGLSIPPTIAPALVPPRSAGQSVEAENFRSMLRLRVAAVMSLAVAIWGTIVLLARWAADPLYSRAVIGVGGIALIAIVVVGWVVGSAVLWSIREWSVRALRTAEFAIVGPHAALLIVVRILQFTAYDPAVPDRAGDFLHAAAGHNGFGWLAALSAWGLLFPHPPRRTLAINAFLCVLPLVTDLGIILADPSRLPAHLLPTAVTVEMLLFGFVLALFGSSRITALQAQVAEARREARDARRLGPYTLKQRLGAGGMGEVYLAEHHLLKRPCAVKLIRPERAGDRPSLARFEREAQSTARLKHPNTVAVLDYGCTDDGTLYYVMELLDGLNLEEVVRRHGPLPPGRVLRVLTQLCGALREAHQAGLIHRDIKPSNVLLCRHGGLFDVVKLVDFGLVAGEGASAHGQTVTQAGLITGTPDYISPEQADGTRADERSDLYALGATAYFLLTGMPPFTGRTVLDILFAHRTQAVPSVRRHAPGVPADLDALVGRMMAKSPHDRPPSAVAVLDSLADCGDCPPWTDTDAEEWWAKVGVSTRGAAAAELGVPPPAVHRPDDNTVK